MSTLLLSESDPCQSRLCNKRTGAFCDFFQKCNFEMKDSGKSRFLVAKKTHSELSANFFPLVVVSRSTSTRGRPGDALGAHTPPQGPAHAAPRKHVVVLGAAFVWHGGGIVLGQRSAYLSPKRVEAQAGTRQSEKHRGTTPRRLAQIRKTLPRPAPGTSRTGTCKANPSSHSCPFHTLNRHVQTHHAQMKSKQLKAIGLPPQDRKRFLKFADKLRQGYVHDGLARKQHHWRGWKEPSRLT